MSLNCVSAADQFVVSGATADTRIGADSVMRTTLHVTIVLGLGHVICWGIGRGDITLTMEVKAACCGSSGEVSGARQKGLGAGCGPQK